LALQAKRAGKSTALLSVDSMRLGAGDEIERLGELLGAPCWLVASPEELASSLTELAGTDLLLIDTPGRVNAECFWWTRVVGSAAAKILVAPAAMRPSCMSQWALRFRPCEFEGLVATKLDEAAGLGVLADMSASTGAPIVGATAGPSPLDGVWTAGAKKLAAMALGFSVNASLGKEKSDFGGSLPEKLNESEPVGRR
jgi:flagellar biosynthesis GTPase FlhF